jgi:hypothetical protein
LSKKFAKMKQTDEIKSMLKELSQSDLTVSQAQFIHGLRKWYKSTGQLSEKQYKCLQSMYDEAFQHNELKHQLS